MSATGPPDNNYWVLPIKNYSDASLAGTLQYGEGIAGGGHHADVSREEFVGERSALREDFEHRHQHRIGGAAHRSGQLGAEPSQVVRSEGCASSIGFGSGRQNSPAATKPKLRIGRQLATILSLAGPIQKIVEEANAHRAIGKCVARILQQLHQQEQSGLQRQPRNRSTGDQQHQSPIREAEDQLEHQHRLLKTTGGGRSEKPTTPGTANFTTLPTDFGPAQTAQHRERLSLRTADLPEPKPITNISSQTVGLSADSIGLPTVFGSVAGLTVLAFKQESSLSDLCLGFEL